MIDFVKVGSKITKCREELNLTQKDVAEKLFVSRQLVSKWEWFRYSFNRRIVRIITIVPCNF